jgi:hypothetical protein
LAVDEMNECSRKVSLLTILLSLFQYSFIGVPAWTFDIDLYHLIEHGIFRNIDRFGPVALRAGNRRHLFAGYVYFLDHLFKP